MQEPHPDTERALRHAQKLEALGRMSAGICHEINNPLTYVLGNLHAARELLGELGSSDPRIEEVAEMLLEAASGADRIGQIVRQMRRFVHPSAEKVSAVVLSDCVESVRRLTEQQCRHRARLTIEIAPGTRVLADRIGLEQVLVNLLINAIDALPEDRRAESMIRLSSRLDASGDVVIEVRDNGRGIGERDLEKVFDPFFTTKPPGRGSGLGLSMSRSIIEGLGGRLELTSELGHGTTATIHLPSAERRAQPSRSLSGPDTGAVFAPQPEAAPARVLVVDDEPAIARFLARALVEHSVTTTTNGREALALFRSGVFDAVLCDLTMPGLDGGATTERTTELLRTCRNRVVAKPIDLAELRSALREVLEPKTAVRRRGAEKRSHPA